MAAWVLYENRRHFLTLLYKNLVDGSVFVCGEIRLDSINSMIVDWVVAQPAAQPGDFIRLPDGTVVQLQYGSPAQA